ncbi:acyl-CoA thioesterase [Agrobacterium vitis]|uniref:acyl-CoA thioesterase n=1 Tax=Agrobacterium vitis TaxID=373 RepID=UPI0015DB6D06|nr:thioesterase family protein [Agrobacterium vitis]MCF1451514.1 hypothetical protein [Agrobacterium vitis]MCF1467422.1 hypothetical protein [Agrobacterium vitis]BCH53479.1 hypothetical protein RvVAR031_10890 [Agrobacterium vitis]
MAKRERLDVTETIIGLRDVGISGRLNNSALLALCEEALHRFWQARPAEDQEPEFRATKFEARLYEALGPGDALRFTVQVDKIGGKSVGFAIAVESGKTRAADVEITWTAVNKDSAEPVALSEALRDWLYQWLP